MSFKEWFDDYCLLPKHKGEVAWKYDNLEDTWNAALAIGRKQGREERDRELDNNTSL